jgi:hypothetical protein
MILGVFERRLPLNGPQQNGIAPALILPKKGGIAHPANVRAEECNPRLAGKGKACATTI